MADLERLAGKRVPLDTHVIIYYLSGVEVFRGAVQALFREMASGSVQGVVSVVTEAELRVGPEVERDEAALRILDTFFAEFPGLLVAPVNREMARVGERPRGEAQRPLPDSLLAATAQGLQCSLIIRSDRAWKGKTGMCELVSLATLI